MFLPKNDRKLLAAMKKAQMTENCFICIDYESQNIYYSTGMYHDDIENALKSNCKVKFNLPKTSIQPIIDYLKSNGLIRTFGSSPAIQVTHEGWINRTISQHEKWQTIKQSILFPIAVSILTTLITMSIKSMF